jgi:glucosamine--fructose-6-phosphate aminotransferase (isomerizing)
MEYQSEKEIFSQPEALEKTYSCIAGNAAAIRCVLGVPGEIVFVACGSSHWLSLSGARTFQLLTGRRATAVKAGDVLMYPGEYSSMYQNPVLICPSRSGRTTEQIEAVRIFREAYGNVPVFALVEYEDTEIEKIADLTIRLPWAKDVSVCQTRSFSCLYLASVLAAAILAENEELLSGMKRYIDASPGLHRLGMLAVEQTERSNPDINYLVSLGSGRQYGIAIEGAYIGIEMALLKAGYYSVLELRHGPIVVVNERTLVAILSGGSAKSMEEGIAGDVRRHGGKVLAVVDRGGFANADWVMELGGEYPPEAVALHFVFLMQAFAFFKAMRLGLNPDSPGDLVPYIRL